MRRLGFNLWHLFRKDPASVPSLADAIKTAVEHHTAGRFSEAQAIYGQVLAIDANNFDALHLLGVLMNQMGQRTRAVELVSRAIALDPSDATAYYNLGTIYSAANQAEEAIGQYQKALAIQPGYLGARLNLGNAFQALGRLDEALASFQMAISLNPAFADAYNSAGVVHGARNQWDEAILSFQRALELKPDYAEAHGNLGKALIGQGRLDEGIDRCRKALSINPKLIDAHFNLGNALKAQGRLDEALASYRSALLLDPKFADAHHNAGVVLIEKEQLEEAILSFQDALSIKPDSARTLYNLGHALTMKGNLADALLCYRKALTLMPEYAEARWAHAMAQIPLIYGIDADLQQFRSAFSRELAELASWFAADSERMANGFKAVGTHQPFYLAYQEENNRDLLSRYGDLCTRLMTAWHERQSVSAQAARDGLKIRLGIVSANFCTHSVWHAIIKGLLLQLDRARFELHLFSVGAVQDQETAFAKSQASRFEQGGKDLHEWVRVIHGSQLDALIYPEIGMDGMTAKLASLRLAPVQAMTWGHPQTSGLPTIDYFLSAEDFEPAGAQGTPPAQEHYTERLVALPHLGCSYPPLSVTATAPNLAGVDIERDAPLLLCPGAPFKYLPQHDWIYVDIARRLRQCKILFVVGTRLESLSEKLRQRLEQVFARAGLDFGKYVAFIPWQQRPEFYGLMEQVDVFLDTMVFSGFNTVMQAIECGLPVVTMDGRFMRGRLGSGILKRMGMAELVARTEQDYIDLAVRLAKDADYRRNVRERIDANRHVLFNDTAPIRGLEDFLINATKQMN